MKVLVFGYSDNPDRYSNMAYQLLNQYQHETFKYNPREDQSLDLPKAVDTVTLYLGRAISDKFGDALLDLDFKRIIINPGAENDKLEEKLKAKGVEVVHGCTLVMLKTNQFDE